MRKEQRDYRILERERMYSIFAPLDEHEPPQVPREPKVIIGGHGVTFMVVQKQRKRRP
jgi:hypothetical protein